jgi:hypothetical protein
LVYNSIVQTTVLSFDISLFQFGWEKEMETKTLKPTMLPPGIEVAPEEIIKNTTRCNCSSKDLLFLAASQSTECSRKVSIATSWARERKHY